MKSMSRISKESSTLHPLTRSRLNSASRAIVGSRASRGMVYLRGSYRVIITARVAREKFRINCNRRRP